MVSQSPQAKAERQSDFFVYVHARRDNGEVFYVGKGRGKRHLSPHGRNPFWTRVAAKADFTASIVEIALSEQEAFDREKSLIAQYRADGAQLTNLTDGGEGPAGRVFSPETLALMRAAKLGKSPSPAHAAAIRASLTGVPWSEERKAKARGRKFSPEHRAALSRACVGRTHTEATKAKIRELKTGIIPSPETLAKMSAASAGERNPHHSTERHHFYHPVHGRRHCTQLALRTEFNLTHSNLSRVVSGKRQRVGGWRLGGAV